MTGFELRTTDVAIDCSAKFATATMTVCICTFVVLCLLACTPFET